MFRAVFNDDDSPSRPLPSVATGGRVMAAAERLQIEFVRSGDDLLVGWTLSGGETVDGKGRYEMVQSIIADFVGRGGKPGRKGGVA